MSTIKSIFKPVNIQITIVQDMAFRSSVDRCQRLGGIYCFHVHDSWSKVFDLCIQSRTVRTRSL